MMYILLVWVVDRGTRHSRKRFGSACEGYKKKKLNNSNLATIVLINVCYIGKETQRKGSKVELCL